MYIHVHVWHNVTIKIPHMGTYCMYKQKSILTSVIVISRNVLEMMESFIFCL